jgi:chromate transporter
VSSDAATPRPPFTTLLREWGRIGCIGFGGPPTHIALLRQLCVDRRRWLSAGEFEDAIAACNLVPGPASTQLAIYCAWRLRERVGALVGGAAFILPGLIVILGLAAFFLGSPPLWARGAAAGASSGVAAVAVQAALSLAPDSRKRARSHLRWLLYAAAGAAAAATIGPWLVLVLFTCGILEISVDTLDDRVHTILSALLAAAVPTAGLAALAWVAIKVGALSYGGGFVIIPLMQADAVNHYHWMTSGQFLNAVALGQITPGPVVHTVAVVGYAAAGLGGGMLASLIAFAPSFAFVLLGGNHFQALRDNQTARSFLNGAGPAAIGAIFGAAIPLARALSHGWQYALLFAALVSLLALRRGIVRTLLVLGILGAILAASHAVSV